jgi:hypothetical protein
MESIIHLFKLNIMKKLFIVSVGLLLSTSILFTSCKKVKNDDSTENVTESQVHSDDQSMEANADDEISTDASTVVEGVTAMTGRGPFFPVPCGAAITYDTLNAAKTITITYNGLNCAGNRFRTGVVTISLPANVKWKDAGAKLTITATNLKITRVVDQKSITINGSKVITNVSGGLLYELSTIGSVTHTITSTGITITFDNNTQRSWQIAKKRVFSYDNGVVITTTGTYSDGGTTGISEWGTNRLGNPFATQIVAPLVIRQDCAWRLTSGQIKHSRMIRTVDVTFGLNSAGNATGCPGAGVYYMKIVWVNVAGNTVTVILPY